MFIDYNGDYQTYVKRSGKTLPYILLFINYYDVFQELYDYDEVMTRITRECAKYGIIIIASINSSGGMRYKLRQNFRSDIALQFNDQDDYSSVIGNTRKLYPSEYRGRGLVKLDNIYEFQTAQIAKEEDLLNRIEELGKELKAKYNKVAPRVPVVPDVVYISDVISALHGMKEIPVGINKDTIAPEVFNFKDNYATLISANELELLPNFVKSLVTIMSKVNSNSILVIDAEGQVKDNYSSDVVYANENFDEVIGKLTSDMEIQYKQYESAGYDNNSVQNNRNLVAIIFGISKLLLKLSPEVKDKFFDYLAKAKSLGTFDIILADQVDNIKKLEYDSWYKGIIQSNYGIWIGNGVADQTLIKTNIGFKKVNNEIPDKYGIVIKNSKTFLVNMINKDVVENESVQKEEKEDDVL